VGEYGAAMYPLARTAAILLQCSLVGALAMAQSEPPSRAPSATPSTLLLELRRPAPLSAGEERALQSLDMFKECPICPDMVVIPAGGFLMGSPGNEDGSDDNERPQHQVTFANRFAVGRFSISFDEWDACVAERGCRGFRPADRGWGRGRQPVINVWWEDANAYVRWLSDKTHRPYRLLSEAEREYVTRAGTTTAFWWGQGLSADAANYDGFYTYPMLKGVKGENRRRSAWP
jgi:formylglycine-generating enzyme required for sulfatase activity